MSLLGLEDIYKFKKGMTRLEKLNQCLDYMNKKEIKEIFYFRAKDLLGVLTKDKCIDFIRMENIKEDVR